MPATLLTVWPLSGETKPSPWTSWMVVVPGTHSSGVGTAAQSGPVGAEPLAALGVGAAIVKSAPLLPVLTTGPFLRWADVELLVAGVGVPPAESLAPPKPTKSTTPAEVEQVVPQVSVVVLLTRATLPAVAPPASATRYRAPAAMLPVRAVLPDHEVPAAEEYCTDQPARSTGAAPVLTSSMKSL